MKKSKLLSIVLCGIMAVGAFGLLAGCKPQNDEKTLKFAGLNGGYGNKWMQAVATEFEKTHEGVKVEVTCESNIESIVTPQLLGGAGPDVVYLATGRKDGLTELMTSSKALENLTDVLQQNVYGSNTKLIDRILPGLMGNGITNPYANEASTHYMLPMFFAGNGLFYNADRFYERETASTTYSPAIKDGKYMMPKTWEEFIALGTSLKTTAGSNYGKDSNNPSLYVFPTAGYLDTMIPASIASSVGKEAVAKCFNYDVNTWKSEGVTKVFENLGQLKDVFWPQGLANANNQDFAKNQQAVIDGKVLFMTNGDWVRDEMKPTTPAGYNWGVSSFMSMGANGQFGTVNAEQIWVNNNSSKKDLANEFLLFLYSDAGLAAIAKNANTAFVPATGYDVIAAQNGIPAGSIAGYQGYYDGTASILAGSFAAASVEGVNWKSIYCAEIVDVLNGSKTVDAWVGDIQSAVEKLAAAIA